jgi:hypothetical protein
MVLAGRAGGWQSKNPALRNKSLFGEWAHRMSATKVVHTFGRKRRYGPAIALLSRMPTQALVARTATSTQSPLLPLNELFLQFPKGYGLP